MKKSVILGLVIVTGVVLAMTGCKSMCGMKNDDMSSSMKSDMSGQHPAGCTCATCAMKNKQSM